MPTKLYHGTNSNFLTSILEKGLVPNEPKEGRGRRAIYLTGEQEVAQTYACYRSEELGGEPVVVEINGALLSQNLFEPDDYDLQFYLDDLHDPVRIGDVGCRTGETVDLRLQSYRKWHEVPAALSLSITKQVAYATIISPHAFVNLFELIEISSRSNLNGPALSVGPSI